MDQDVEQMEADENLPMQQSDDKSEELVDTNNVDNKETPSDIDLTGDFARNESVEESNLTEGTDREDDCIEGMEIDESVPASEACPDIVINEDNDENDDKASHLMEDVPAPNVCGNENQVELEKDASSVHEEAENFGDEKNSAEELNEDEVAEDVSSVIYNPEEIKPDEIGEICMTDDLEKTAGDEEQELEQPCTSDPVNEESLDLNEKLSSETESKDTSNGETEHKNEESIGDEPQFDNSSEENVGDMDIDETGEPVNLNQECDLTNASDIDKIDASHIDNAVNIIDTKADGAIDNEEKYDGNKGQVLMPSVDVLDDESAGANVKDDGIKQQSFFQDIDTTTESEKVREEDLENTEYVDLLSNDDTTTSTDVIEVPDEIQLGEKQELETDSSDKLVDIDKVIDEETSAYKIDLEENQRAKSEDVVICDEGYVELADNKVELSEEKVKLSDDKDELYEEKGESIDDSEMDITENIDSDENNENIEGDEVEKNAQEVEQEAEKTDSDVIESTVEETTVSDLPIKQDDVDVMTESSGSDETVPDNASIAVKNASVHQETDSNEMETDVASASQVVKTDTVDISDDLKSRAAGNEDNNAEVSMETTDVENNENQSKEKVEDQSEESEDRNSLTPSDDMAGIEIKQERHSSTDEDKGIVTESSNSSNLKIVGVTSAVGVDDKEVGSEENSSIKGDDKMKSETETTGEPKTEKKETEDKSDTKAWMSENDYRDDDFENMNLSTLDSLLQKFYASLQSKKSVSYSRSALVAIRAGINRHITAPPYSRLLNLMKDREFMPSNQVLRGIFKGLKKEGKDVSKSKELITEEDHAVLYECGVFSVDEPETLQNKVIYEIIAHFGRLCRETLKSLMKSSLTIKEDIDGRRYVIMTDNETHRIDNREKSKEARMYETGDEFCPVRSFEKYTSKLHPDCGRLFQRPIRSFSVPMSEVWYESSPLGINKIDSFMARLSKTADLSQRYTNNCIRTIVSTNLHCQRSSNGAIISGSRHRSVESLTTNMKPCLDNEDDLTCDIVYETSSHDSGSIEVLSDEVTPHRSVPSLTTYMKPCLDNEDDLSNDIVYETSSHDSDSIEVLSDEVTPVEDQKPDILKLENLLPSSDIDNEAASSSSTIVLSSDISRGISDKFSDSDNLKFNEIASLTEGEDEDVIAVKEEKKPTPKTKSSKIQTCIVCKKVVKCKYNIVRNGDVKHLCDDNCFKRFRGNPTTYLKQAETKDEKVKTCPTIQPKENTAPASNAKPVVTSKSETNQPPPLSQQSQVYKTCTVCQLMNVRTSKPFLNWQGLDFCGEECLGKFQFGLDSNCSYCSGPIFPNNKAKFCCRAGNEVKHFCSSVCNNDFVKRMKLCAYCSKDLSHIKDSFMAPVGNQGTFKDFCSQTCLQKFEDKNNKDLEIVGVQTGQKTSKAPKGDFTCAVCSKFGPVKHEFKLDSKMNRLCSDPCFSAFQYANKLTMNACDNCSTNLNAENQAPQYVQFEGQQKRFCSFMCVNVFMNSNKKTVPCAWCGSKKSNFDMIERVDANNKYQLFCSLNCLSLYRVNLQASSNQSVVCDQCRKFVPAQYHLTMSDASVRNFCSYGCVMQFQQQFQMPAKQPVQQNTAAPGKTASQVLQKQQQQTTTRSGRVVTKGSKIASILDSQKQQKAGKKDSFPVISNVMSLAPQGPQQQMNNKSTPPVINQPVNVKVSSSSASQAVQQKVIIQPPPPKVMKNKYMICKPITQTKATSCRPHTQTKEVQTDGKAEPDKLPVPIPVPIYCPTPLAMYSVPTPVFVAIPVPVPVPIFIPTTKKSANSILKQIKDIREKIPADPLEAELLMMAEAVAGKGEDSSSSSEEEDTSVPVVKEAPAVPAPSGGAELGEDMLQMALRMASEMSDEPVMDLETSLEPVAVNTEPPPQPKPEIPPEPEEEDEYIPSTRARRSRGGSKRQSRSSTRRNPKRQKVEVPQVYREPTPSPPAPAAPPPDANFHLKYTYGVNAFKHWVIQKNSQIEQSSRPGQGKALKTFKTDILQSTADELNYALCLFVKEVRKPNGEEYAVDSIYYLCLGIQQYLFENGRIDNIFTDFYYERFTEGLNEILTRYEPKLNHAGQLVCRIEEEHLWESKQLGAHSPHVLLNSLVYFNTKYFMLKTSEDHLKLSFTHIMKHWKKTASGRGSGTGPNAGRSVYLRYYCPTPQGKVDNQKKKKEEMPVYEQTENLENPLRCPVKLYEFYLSKCPESIKSRNDTFYLQAERSSVPDSPVWYSNISVDGDRLAKLLNRIRLVREIQEAHLHTQPIYI